MDYISAWCKSQRRLEDSTAIVTGCNTGIGRETVLDLYKRGARVIMACRDVNKAETAKEEIENQVKTASLDGEIGTLVVEMLDLSSLKSVREFVFRILATETKVNILINNAGVMCCPAGKTEDGFETHMGTNHFDFNIDLDDMNFEKIPYDPLMAYCRSKAANVLFARALGQKLREHNIKHVTTYSVHPGIINTEISRHFSDTVWHGATWVFRNVLGWFLKSARCGAQTTIYCAVDEACASENGLYYCECAVSPASMHCQDDKVAAQLWDRTVESLKLVHYDPFGGEDPKRDSFQ